MFITKVLNTSIHPPPPRPQGQTVWKADGAGGAGGPRALAEQQILRSEPAVLSDAPACA